MGTIFDIFSDIFEDNRCALVYLLYVAVGIALYMNPKWEIRGYLRSPRWKWVTAAVILGHLLSIGLVFACGWQTNIGFILLVLAGNAGIDFLLFFWLKKVPDKERKRLEEILEKKSDLLREYYAVTALNEAVMIPPDLKRYKRVLYHLLCQMGDIQRAYNIMTEEETENSPERLMYESVLEEVKGHLVQAEEKMKAALDLSDEKKNRKLHIQLLNNYGRNCRIRGNSEEAAFYYNKAKELLQPGDTKELIHNVYYNYIANECFLGRDLERLTLLKREYQAMLDMENFYDIVEYRNLELFLAKQTHDRELTVKVIENGMEMIRGKLQEEEMIKRLNYEVSSFRLAHTSGVDVRPCLEAIRNDFGILKELAMPERYYLIKELHIAVREEAVLPEQMREEFSDIFDYAVDYIEHKAKADLQKYIQTLPESAVYAYGHAQEEIVGIERYQERYSYSDCRKRMLSVRDTYERRELEAEAMRVSLNWADENFQLLNVDDNMEVIHRDEVREALEYAERIVKGLLYHPAFAEDYLRLAFCYMHLYEYQKGKQYYRQFAECNIAPEHYTPWMQGNIEFVRVMTFVDDVQTELIRLKTDKEALLALSPKAKQWIAAYPESSSEDITLLWGSFFVGNRYPIHAKMLYWRDADGGMRDSYFWLIMPQILWNGTMEIAFELDMAYPQISEEDAVDFHKRIFFADTHPLQTKKSIWLQRLLAKQVQISDIECKNRFFPTQYPDGRITYLEEIRLAVVGKLTDYFPGTA
ncbi:MAG: hypothetical protein NC300_04075 [Bacteroidales bacterium]|nr:hypothetical protein [Clostridium sp.]MCM1203299.1 hypothetical protein [Bacteroidales bacterium]